MDNFANAASGNSGIYGQSGPVGMGTGDALALVNQLKDREMRDFKDKANFMADLSLKQDRLRKLYDPANMNGDSGNINGGMNGQPRSVMLARDPTQMTPYEKGELGIRQQQVGMEGQRIAQEGKLGQGRLDIQQEKERLNEEKNRQIFETKQADMQRKIEESNAKLELAQKQLDSKNTNAENALQAHKDIAAAIEERHKLEMQQMQMKYDELKRMHDATIANMNNKTNQNRNTRTTTEINPEGTRRTTTTERGFQNKSSNVPTQNPDGTYSVVGPDGKKYTIPANKLDDWNQNHQPESEQDENQSDNEGEE